MRWQHQHRDLLRRVASVAHLQGDETLVEGLPADGLINDSLQPTARLEARDPAYTSPGNTYGGSSTSGSDNTEGGDGGGGGGGSGGDKNCKNGEKCSSGTNISANTLPIALGVM